MQHKYGTLEYWAYLTSDPYLLRARAHPAQELALCALHTYRSLHNVRYVFALDGDPRCVKNKEEVLGQLKVIFRNTRVMVYEIF